MPDELAYERDLNHFWNAVVTGAAADPVALDPADIALVRRMHQAVNDFDSRPTAERNWEDVLARIAAGSPPEGMMLTAKSIAPGRIVRSPDGRLPSASVLVPQTPRDWSMRTAGSILATAALVVFVVIGSLFAGGPLRHRFLDALVAIPAISGSPTAVTGVTTQLLLDQHDVPLTPGHGSITLMIVQLEPGVSYQEPGYHGTFLFAVEEGSVEIQLSGGAQNLSVGDQYVGVTTHGSTITNTGTSPAQVYQLELNDAATEPETIGYAFSDPTRGCTNTPISTSATFPPEASRVTVERLTLQPGASLPPQIANGWDWIGIGAGRLGVKLAGDHLPFRWKSGSERTFGIGQQMPPISADTEVILRNADDQPLTLYRLVIIPASTATPPP
ncbi:MAG: hypothetical protein U0031_10690 [Thermomicrobiales bacterium]